MIEKIVYDYLKANMAVDVFTELPAAFYSPCVVLEKTSSGLENYIKTATIAVQSYGNSLYEAASLNEDVKAAMLNIITLNSIASCKLNSDYNFTDTTTKRYRYQAVFNITYY